MMTRSEKIRLGIFLLSSAAIVVAAIIALAGLQLMTKFDVYTTHFDETVSGLEKGARIKYNGVQVGQVADIKIDPQKMERVVVTLELREGTPIKADTQAVLRAQGITGMKFVELTGGTTAAKTIPPGSVIKSDRSLLGMIEGKAEDIALKTELLITRLNDLFSDRNISAVDEIIANVNTLTGKASQIVQNNDEKIDTMVDDFSVASADLKAAIASVRRSSKRIESVVQFAQPKVNEVVDDLSETADVFRITVKNLVKVDGVLKKIEQTFTEINKQISEIELDKMADSAKRTIAETEAAVKSIRRTVESSRENIYRSSKSLRITLQNLEQLSAELRDQPSLLLNADPPNDRTPPERRRKRED